MGRANEGLQSRGGAAVVGDSVRGRRRRKC